MSLTCMLHPSRPRTLLSHNPTHLPANIPRGIRGTSTPLHVVTRCPGHTPKGTGPAMRWCSTQGTSPHTEYENNKNLSYHPRGSALQEQIGHSRRPVKQNYEFPGGRPQLYALTLPLLSINPLHRRSTGHRFTIHGPKTNYRTDQIQQTAIVPY